MPCIAVLTGQDNGQREEERERERETGASIVTESECREVTRLCSDNDISDDDVVMMRTCFWVSDF